MKKFWYILLGMLLAVGLAAATVYVASLINKVTFAEQIIAWTESARKAALAIKPLLIKH